MRSGYRASGALSRPGCEREPPAAAKDRARYGRSASSVLVSLGQQVDGTVIKLFPAHRVAGRVVIASGHKDGVGTRVELIARLQDRTVTCTTNPMASSSSHRRSWARRSWPSRTRPAEICAALSRSSHVAFGRSQCVSSHPEP